MIIIFVFNERNTYRLLKHYKEISYSLKLLEIIGKLHAKNINYSRFCANNVINLMTVYLFKVMRRNI